MLTIQQQGLWKARLGEDEHARTQANRSRRIWANSDDNIRNISPSSWPSGAKKGICEYSPLVTTLFIRARLSRAYLTLARLSCIVTIYSAYFWRVAICQFLLVWVKW